MFNIYANELIVELSNRRVGCHIDDVCVNDLSHADDMVLLSASICSLRELIRVCEEYVTKLSRRANMKDHRFVRTSIGVKRNGTGTKNCRCLLLE